MGNYRAYSHLWDLTLRKLFPKRLSLPKATNSQLSWCGLECSTGEDHTDGFYKYSQEILEKERYQELLRSSNSTAYSYTSALTAPSDRPPLPYTVSSPDWNIFSPYVKNLEAIEDGSVCEWLASVLFVWSKVYTLSKIVVMAFMHYGVDLDEGPDGIIAHMTRAEELVLSSSITDLIDNTESLYYALYARLIMEIAGADLCSSFTLEFRRLPIKSSFILPEPSQLCKILFMCKRTLDEPTMCINLNKELVTQHQKLYINRTTDKLLKTGFIMDDLTGYREHALGVVKNQSSDFYQKWSRASVLYQMPPGNVLALQSEKYLSLTPKLAVQQIVPALNLPFVEACTIAPEAWQRELILDHRQATLAKLEGKCVGEARRDEGRRRLLDFARERKCICQSNCICALDCTQQVERCCPCAERLLSLMIAERRNSVGPLPFGPRCSALAKASFQGIASVRSDASDEELLAEIGHAINTFTEEIRKQRSAGAIKNRGVI